MTLSVLSVGASGTSGGFYRGEASMRGGAWDRSGHGWDGISELNTVRFMYSPG